MPRPTPSAPAGLTLADLTDLTIHSDAAIDAPVLLQPSPSAPFYTARARTRRINGVDYLVLTAASLWTPLALQEGTKP